MPSETPETDALLAERRHQDASDWNADDVMTFLRHGRQLEQQRDDYRDCCEGMARVLKMHDQSQISLTIGEWEEMKKNTLEFYAKLQTESKKP